MTNYTYIKNLIVAKKAKKDGKNRFRAAMVVGGALTLIVLVMNGWTVLDAELVNPLMNHGFSVLMVLAGGTILYTVDQIVLGIQISDLERRLLHSLEDFHKENRRKESAFLRNNRDKVVRKKPELRSGCELQDIGNMIRRTSSLEYERVDGFTRRE